MNPEPCDSFSGVAGSSLFDGEVVPNSTTYHRSYSCKSLHMKAPSIYVPELTSWLFQGGKKRDRPTFKRIMPVVCCLGQLLLKIMKIMWTKELRKEVRDFVIFDLLTSVLLTPWTAAEWDEFREQPSSCLSDYKIRVKVNTSEVGLIHFQFREIQNMSWRCSLSI